MGGQLFRISYLNDQVTLTCVGTATTTLASSLNPSTYGQSVTFTVTVINTTGAGGVPTGSVEFYDGSNDLGAGTALSGSGTTATSTFTISTFTAGTHSILAVYTSTGDFQGNTSSTLTQTVIPATLTITANNQTKVYGAALPTLTASYSGFVNGDTTASLTTQPTLTTTATAGSHVAGSPYSITASGAVDSNYTINYVSGTLTVTADGADDHGQQPDQGLRRGAADPDGLVLGLRQWRHRRQPDHPADAEHAPQPPVAMSRAARTASRPAARPTVTTASATSQGL